MRGIDSYLRDKISQQNQTIWNNAEHRMSIQLSRARTTVMDSTYWTVETIQTKDGLGDISVAARRQKAQGRPDKLFNIHIDNGIVKTATRDYPDYQKNRWNNQFDLGSGTACAIAFDGYWDLYREKWQMVTSETPWLFWVNNGILYAQMWDDETTRTELSTNVSKVKAIRGWVNVNIIELDQGVICGYIKDDGKVYYRNFCRQADETYVWETEQEVTEFSETSVNLNLFITNDYRVGFVAENSAGNIKWVISERAWAGLGIVPDNISVAPGQITADFIQLDLHRADAEEQVSVAPGQVLVGTNIIGIQKAMNVAVMLIDEGGQEFEDWGWAIEFTTQNPMPGLELSNLTFMDVMANSSIAMSSLEYLGNNRYRVSVDPIVVTGINNVFGDIQMTISNALNPVGSGYDEESITLKPINLVPEDIPLPEVSEVWNE